MRSYISMAVIIAFIFSTIPLPAQQPEPKKLPYMAVMDLQVGPGLPEELGSTLSQKIGEVLINTRKYLIIDRASIGIMMEEIARSQGGCFDESCALEAGKLLSAQIIITGKVSKLGADECQISAKMTDVERGEIMRMASDLSECSGQALNEAAENVAFDLAGIERKPGKLIIQSNPGGGTVYVDGNNVGTTPLDTEVRPGKHTVIVTKKGYDNAEQVITVAPGVSMSLNVTLKKAEKKWYNTWWFYSIVGVAALGAVGGGVAAAGGGGNGGGGATPVGSLNLSW